MLRHLRTKERGEQILRTGIKAKRLIRLWRGEMAGIQSRGGNTLPLRPPRLREAVEEAGALQAVQIAVKAAEAVAMVG